MTASKPTPAQRTALTAAADDLAAGGHGFLPIPGSTAMYRRIEAAGWVDYVMPPNEPGVRVPRINADGLAAIGRSDVPPPPPVEVVDPETVARDARRGYSRAGFPLLYRRTEVDRIEAEHDARPELIDNGRRTTAWFRAAAAAMRQRTTEIDDMVAALRPGDRVRQVDDAAGTVWVIHDVRDGNDGWVWLSLRQLDADLWTGCRARSVDLVEHGTDDAYVAEATLRLDTDRGHGWLTDAEYAARLESILASVSRATPPPATPLAMPRRRPARREVVVEYTADAVYPGAEGPVRVAGGQVTAVSDREGDLTDRALMIAEGILRPTSPGDRSPDRVEVTAVTASGQTPGRTVVRVTLPEGDRATGDRPATGDRSPRLTVAPRQPRRRRTPRSLVTAGAATAPGPATAQGLYPPPAADKPWGDGIQL